MATRILFLCTGNSVRSQIAEAFLRKYGGDAFIAFSAGLEPKGIHRLTIQVMQEIGIDISKHQSKNLTAFDGQNFDYVITLCGSANETCPLYIGGTKKTHIGFDDPAKAHGLPEAILTEFRRVRDEMKEKLTVFFKQRK